ncbi:MAG: hypothetical protein EXQ74_03890 [Thermoleophilia bacterium]|nr:hypothetical protein [Thermoleophilia bacterium]
MTDSVFPLLLETGMGVDLTGDDATKAACRAVEATIHRNLFPRMADVLPGNDRANMRVEVTVAVPDPDQVDLDVVAGLLPYGRVSVRAVPGGLRQPNGLIGDDGEEGTILVAIAIIGVGW